MSLLRFTAALQLVGLVIGDTDVEAQVDSEPSDMNERDYDGGACFFSKSGM